MTINARFDNWSIEQGLPQSTVNGMVQDSLGFIWIATLSGLSRFDGQGFSHFTTEDGSINDNYLTALAVDQQGWIWVGSRRGLSRINSYTNQYQGFLFDQDDPDNLSKAAIRDIYVDRDDQVWVATHAGLSRFDRHTDQFQFIPLTISSTTDSPIDSPMDSPIEKLGLVSMASNSNNQLFILAETGQVYTLAQDQLQLTSYQSHVNSEKLLIDQHDQLWLGGNGVSVVIYDVNHQPHTLTLMGKGDVRDMTEDNQGNIWIATLSGGVQVVSPDLTVRSINDNTAFHTKRLIDDAYRSLLVDREGVVWIGSVKFGIFRQNQLATQINQYIDHKYDSTAPFAVAESVDQSIWLGLNGRIDILSPEDFSRKTASIKTEGYTFDLYQLNADTWLAGTDRGIVKIEKKNETFMLNKVYQSTEVGVTRIIRWGDSLYLGAHNGIYYVEDLYNWQHPIKKLSTTDLAFDVDVFYYAGLVDQQRRLWFVGMQGILVLIDPQDNQIQPQQLVVNEKGQGTTITDLLLLNDNSLLLSSYNGLFQYDMKHNRITRLNTIAEQYQICSQVDQGKSIWLNTSSGVIELDKSSLQIKRSLNERQGMISQHCNVLAGLLTTKQCVVFGSLKGVIEFCPHQLPAADQLTNQPMLFTSIDINFEQNLPFSHYSQYSNESILTTNRLDLDHQVKQIALEFTLMDFNHTGLTYAYKMDNLMDEWVKTQDKKVSFTTLPSGRYQLQIKAFDKLRPEHFSMTQLQIIKASPWWLTPWAYLVYLLLIILCLVLFYKLRTLRNKRVTRQLKNLVHMKTAELVEKNNEILEKKQALEVATRRQAQLLEQKNTMLSAVSHEMKTPLTVIKGALQYMVRNSKSKSSALELLESNCDRLSAFVDQILLVSKFKTLQVVEVEPIPFSAIVRTVASYLEPMTTRYAQHIKLDIQDEIELNGHAASIELVVNNLIKNAIVHAGRGCSIEVSLVLNDQIAILRVSDNGKGIDESMRLCMFEPFMSDSNHSSGMHSSMHSGLGLSLCQEIVAVHQGEISVQSAVGQGTCVAVELPQCRLQPKDQDYKSCLPKFMISPPADNDHGNNKPSLLIVDDEPDILVLLSLQLNEDYRLILADGGEQALDLIQKSTPDLIIIDRYMPHVSGIEVLRQVRLQEQTKNIPVIMFSADTSDENQIEGLREGSDLFIKKPFDYYLLKANINRLLEKVLFANQENSIEAQLQSTELAESPSNAQLQVAREKAFLIQLSEVVQQHYQDPNFTVKSLVSQFSMSEVTFRQKVQQMTGSLPKHYLFNYRCEKAKLRLGLERDIAIKDISEACGFKDEAQMRRWFKEFYGMTPSQMR